MQHYPFVFIGETALAMGLAAALSNRGIPSLTVERGSLPAPEFTAALRTRGSMACAVMQSPEANLLKGEFVRRHAIAPCGDSLPALQPILCKSFGDCNPKAGKGGLCDLFTASVILSDEWDGEKHVLEIFTTGGVWGVTADRILDTTTARAAVTRRFLNANLDCRTAASGTVAGRFTGERYLRMPVADGTDYPTARRALQAFWRSRGEELKDAKLLMIASEFDEDCIGGVTKTGEGAYSLPSAAYPTVLHAYDAGAVLADSIAEVLK